MGVAGRESVVPETDAPLSSGILSRIQPDVDRNASGAIMAVSVE